MYYALVLFSYIAALVLPVPVFMAFTFVIALRYRGYLCLLVAALIDLQFSMAVGGVPLYTLLTIAVLVGAEIIRPRLRLEVAV
jgi:uncharacterized membrane protein HdeD (DUF308 family)